MPTLISIVGRSQSGKTTLIEKLIPELKKRGYKIGTIKHSHHTFDIDKSGKDSSRHKDAGAEAVIVASPGKIAMIKNEESESPDNLLKYFDNVDLVITEGYKKEPKPKIEVVRSARHSEIFCKNDPNLMAVVTDANMQLDVPVFGLDNVVDLADFIEDKFLRSL